MNEFRDTCKSIDALSQDPVSSFFDVVKLLSFVCEVKPYEVTSYVTQSVLAFDVAALHSNDDSNLNLVINVFVNAWLEGQCLP